LIANLKNIFLVLPQIFCVEDIGTGKAHNTPDHSSVCSRPQAISEKLNFLFLLRSLFVFVFIVVLSTETLFGSSF
jgi:hypothetical protein